MVFTISPIRFMCHFPAVSWLTRSRRAGWSVCAAFWASPLPCCWGIPLAVVALAFPTGLRWVWAGNGEPGTLKGFPTGQYFIFALQSLQRSVQDHASAMGRQEVTTVGATSWIHRSLWNLDLYMLETNNLMWNSAQPPWRRGRVLDLMTLWDFWNPPPCNSGCQFLSIHLLDQELAHLAYGSHLACNLLL